MKAPHIKTITFNDWLKASEQDFNPDTDLEKEYLKYLRKHYKEQYNRLKRLDKK